MAEKIKFEQVIAYINDMGSEDHLSNFLPEDRHLEFLELQSAFDHALARFKETAMKWANESYEQGQTLEEITLLLNKGVNSPAAFVQQVQQLTGVEAKKGA